ncbi:metal-dependent phosphoesterase [Arthrobacter sp. Soil782]|uniref:PHP domain-containing protein n=1 Tax=Arthrobacter sp. Soil782 TaxID=1736410 RepID=UPI0006F2052B|nr:PHP domain-containing protein [Arthrobacter sp. Soil782]KRF08543.1 metal-dependent phosphoesterase [Arthrobacter sp. Soil782]
MRIDLHAHSNVSDGTESPADLMRAAAAAGLDVIALTDHDATAGWAAAMQEARNLSLVLVPGMEVSCRTDTGISVHVLSYLHDPEHPGLLAEIGRSRDARLTRAERMVEKLAADYPISWAHVLEHVADGATIGRPHIADTLVTLNVVGTRSEAFANMLSARSPYWVSHYAPHPADAVALVREAGGVPVFAHPVASARGRIVDSATTGEMIDAGLLGLEIHHRDNPPEGREELQRIAARHSLLVTGSSDYHGTGKPNRLGENVTSPEMFARLEEMATGSSVIR